MPAYMEATTASSNDALNGVQQSFLDRKMSSNNSGGSSYATANSNPTTPTKLTNGSSMASQKQEPNSAALMKIKTYLLALRPWSLSASLVPTILGSAIAYRTPGDFNFVTFVLTIFTVITVHGAGNVVNTYFDFVKGIDNRKSDDRTLVDHILTKDEVLITTQFILFIYLFRNQHDYFVPFGCNIT